MFDPDAFVREVVKIVDEWALPKDRRKRAVVRLLAQMRARHYATEAEAVAAAQRLLRATNKHSSVFKVAPPGQGGGPRPPRITTSAGRCTVRMYSLFNAGMIPPVRAALAAAARRGLSVTIDMRHNGGGDMNPMLLALTPLIPEGAVVSCATRRDGSPIDVALQGPPAPENHFKVASLADVPRGTPVPRLSHVTVLIGPRTGSSGEITALALSYYGARLVGRPTAGYLTANDSIPIMGYSVQITYAYCADPGGRVRYRLRPTAKKRR